MDEEQPLTRDEFIQAMADELRRVDQEFTATEAYNIARDALLWHLECEEIEYGDERMGWTQADAVSVIWDMEIYYWESEA